MSLSVVQVQSSSLPTGAATEATAAAASAKLPASLGQKPLAGSMSVAIASDQGPVPVGVVGTVPVSIAGTVSVTGTVSDAQLPASLGQKPMAGSMSVAIASDQGTLPVSGPQTDAQLRAFAAALWVTAVGAVNTSVTATLPAPGAGLFHYITSIRVTKLYALVGVASGTGVTITTTNLPGGPAWTTEQAAGALGTAVKVVDEVCGLPIKSAAANAATTIVCPAQAQTIWRVNVTYYTGP